MKIQRRVLVRGDVQGVGFRAATFREAIRYRNLFGYVKNLDDGRVEAVFVGEQDAVLEMIAWCRVGPSSATVTGLEVFEEVLDPALSGFSVR